MFRSELNEHSPLRVLDTALSGGVGVGRLAVVTARAGVGKTAFLVQVGLDALLQEQRVLHVSIGDSIDDVRGWYDSLFNDLARRNRLDDVNASRLLVERHRMIQTFADTQFSAAKLHSIAGMLAEHAGFRPAHILIDGLDWSKIDGEVLEAFKATATLVEGDVWLTALSHREDPVNGDLPRPLTRLAEHIDVAVALQPRSTHVDLQILKGGASEGGATSLALDPDTMTLVDHRATDEFAAIQLAKTECTLYSGGAPGTEAAFGECAEEYGLQEVNFTFEGHQPARSRGLVNLNDKELRQGDVSLAYVSRRMNRNFTSSTTFRRVLQSIWHQVNHSQQVLVVGVIQEDGSVKGGTGWGAELARVWNKPLWVFDQEKKAWFRWNSLQAEWTRTMTPRLISTNVCGTGTRFLTDEGRTAIQAVFKATFPAE
jgi:hypothetical protein